MVSLDGDHPGYFRRGGTDFTYVGTQAGDYLVTGPDWQGAPPQGVTHAAKRQSTPKNSVLVIGRVLVESDSDVAMAYELSKQIQLTPLSGSIPK